MTNYILNEVNIIESGRVGYEELLRLRFVLSAKAEPDNTSQGLNNSFY